MRRLLAVLSLVALTGCRDECKPAREELFRADNYAHLCRLQLASRSVRSCAGEEQELRIAEARVAQVCR